MGVKMSDFEDIIKEVPLFMKLIFVAQIIVLVLYILLLVGGVKLLFGL